MLPLVSSNMVTCSEKKKQDRNVLQVPNISCTNLQKIVVQAQHQLEELLGDQHQHEWCVFSRVMLGSVICEGTSG